MLDMEYNWKKESIIKNCVKLINTYSSQSRHILLYHQTNTIELLYRLGWYFGQLYNPNPNLKAYICFFTIKTNIIELLD